MVIHYLNIKGVSIHKVKTDTPLPIYESVDLIAFLFNNETNQKFYHRHIVDISESRASLTGGQNFWFNEEIGRKGIKSTGSFMRIE